jgi:AcrR family transcriptional regulator
MQSKMGPAHGPEACPVKRALSTASLPGGIKDGYGGSMSIKASTNATSGKPSRERGGRPAAPLITRERAAAVALALIDRDGLKALSLQAVARDLGVSAPSLYHHFSDKDALLAEVARYLLAEIGTERERWSRDWEVRMIELGTAARRVALRHPDAALLLLRFFPRQLMLQAYEAGLRDCPYPVETHMIVHETIEKFTFGSALFAAAAHAQHISAMPPIEAAFFPKLAAARERAPSDEMIFEESLKAILDGLRARFAPG